MVSIVVREREKLLLSRAAMDDCETLASWLLRAYLIVSDIASRSAALILCFVFDSDCKVNFLLFVSMDTVTTLVD